jgi:hypothetical protein
MVNAMTASHADRPGPFPSVSPIVASAQKRAQTPVRRRGSGGYRLSLCTRDGRQGQSGAPCRNGTVCQSRHRHLSPAHFPPIPGRRADGGDRFGVVDNSRQIPSIRGST